MFATKHFVFLHVPKTGGSFIRELCEAHLPPESIVDISRLDPERSRQDSHAGFEAIPAELADLPVICFVRNPWDWYVSSYHFNNMSRRPGQPERPGGWKWKALFGCGRNSFEEMVRVSCTTEQAGRPLVHPKPPGPRWFSTMRTADIDYYSALFKMTVGEGVAAGKVEVGRYESLRSDFLAFLERHDVPVPEALVQAIRTAGRRNESPREDYRRYYDDDLRDLVASKARKLIADYRYTF